MSPQPTLHIRQSPAGKGKHAIRLTLRRPGQPDLEGEATIKFSLTDQEQEDLRWYMEDYLQQEEPAHAVTVEQVEALLRARRGAVPAGAGRQPGHAGHLVRGARAVGRPARRGGQQHRRRRGHPLGADG